MENNFNSDVAKMWSFLPTTHMLTPHIKRKKCKKKKNSKSCRMRPTLQKREKRVTMQQERKEKEEKRREKKKEEGRNPWCRADHPGRPPRPSAWSHRPWVRETHDLFVCFFFFLFFFFPSGDLGSLLDLAERISSSL